MRIIKLRSRGMEKPMEVANMCQIEFCFNWNCFTEIQSEGRNPVRIVEKEVLRQGKYPLVKSDSHSLTMDVGADDRETVKEWLEQLTREQFPEYMPHEKEGFWLAKPNRIQSFRTGASEECKKPTRKVEPAEQKVQEVVAEKQEEQPRRLPKALEGYLEEWCKVVPRLKQTDNMECIWSRNLMVAMDEGYGWKEFVERMAAPLIAASGYSHMQPADVIKRMKVTYPSAPDKKFDSWDRLLDRAAELQHDNQRSIKRMIFLVDLSQWRWELRTGKVREYLNELTGLADNFICMFQVPYIGETEMEELTRQMEGELGIKTLSVPPFSKEEMLEYVKKGVEGSGFYWTTEGEEALKDWLSRERESFQGLRTLNKMIHNLIYGLVLHKPEDERQIHRADVERVIPRQKEYREPYKKLEELIGLEDVKRQVRQLVVQMKTQQELRNAGKEVEKPTLHMMFTGNPGTGKTTVARIVAQIMKEEGVLSRGQFFEIKGRDLCGRFVGETAPKTSNYCRDAQGSVLFIDEAYGLCQNRGGNDYGREALNTLITEMENHREDFCVIMAGYENEMQELMEMNSGLESRIPHQIKFPNYSREEMKEIFFKMMDGVFEYEQELPVEVERFLEDLPDELLQSDSFSNARMVRNFFERIWGKAAYRKHINKEEELTIKKEDLWAAREEREFRELTGGGQKKRHSIGF
ncbi:MAG: AAA family ATPase [Lachnospiraceae bacterium]|nr:AAA family ATPase [Lachnospiraceae bacterium]